MGVRNIVGAFAVLAFWAVLALTFDPGVSALTCRCIGPHCGNRTTCRGQFCVVGSVVTSDDDSDVQQPRSLLYGCGQASGSASFRRSMTRLLTVEGECVRYSDRLTVGYRRLCICGKRNMCNQRPELYQAIDREWPTERCRLGCQGEFCAVINDRTSCSNRTFPLLEELVLNGNCLTPALMPNAYHVHSEDRSVACFCRNVSDGQCGRGRAPIAPGNILAQAHIGRCPSTSYLLRQPGDQIRHLRSECHGSLCLSARFDYGTSQNGVRRLYRGCILKPAAKFLSQLGKKGCVSFKTPVITTRFCISTPSFDIRRNG